MAQESGPGPGRDRADEAAGHRVPRRGQGGQAGSPTVAGAGTHGAGPGPRVPGGSPGNQNRGPGPTDPAEHRGPSTRLFGHDGQRATEPPAAGRPAARASSPGPGRTRASDQRRGRPGRKPRAARLPAPELRGYRRSSTTHRAASASGRCRRRPSSHARHRSVHPAACAGRPAQIASGPETGPGHADHHPGRAGCSRKSSGRDQKSRDGVHESGT